MRARQRAVERAVTIRALAAEILLVALRVTLVLLVLAARLLGRVANLLRCGLTTGANWLRRVRMAR